VSGRTRQEPLFVGRVRPLLTTLFYADSVPNAGEVAMVDRAFAGPPAVAGPKHAKPRSGSWGTRRGHADCRAASFRPVSDADFKNAVDAVSKVIDGAGVAVIVVGLLVATAAFALALKDRDRSQVAYRVYRQQVGKAILLGLEFLVAADIIRTVAVAPTFAGVGVLAILVVVRTFLSFTLDVELSGTWPWQSRPKPAESSS
jgi:uncharacterized membrane protein